MKNKKAKLYGYIDILEQDDFKLRFVKPIFEEHGLFFWYKPIEKSNVENYQLSVIPELYKGYLKAITSEQNKRFNFEISHNIFMLIVDGIEIIGSAKELSEKSTPYFSQISKFDKECHFARFLLINNINKTFFETYMSFFSIKEKVTLISSLLNSEEYSLISRNMLLFHLRKKDYCELNISLFKDFTSKDFESILSKIKDVSDYQKIKTQVDDWQGVIKVHVDNSIDDSWKNSNKISNILA